MMCNSATGLIFYHGGDTGRESRMAIGIGRSFMILGRIRAIIFAKNCELHQYFGE